MGRTSGFALSLGTCYMEAWERNAYRPSWLPLRSINAAYGAVLADVTDLLESARHAAARSVNSIMTATYWAVGRRIIEEEQRGKKRADYGEQLVTRLAKDLTIRYGRGYGHRNIFSTKHRESLISRELQPRLFAYIGGILRDERQRPPRRRRHAGSRPLARISQSADVGSGSRSPG